MRIRSTRNTATHRLGPVCLAAPLANAPSRSISPSKVHWLCLKAGNLARRRSHYRRHPNECACRADAPLIRCPECKRAGGLKVEWVDDGYTDSILSLVRAASAMRLMCSRSEVTTMSPRLAAPSTTVTSTTSLCAALPAIMPT